jgi:hypothetical protein
LRDTGRKPGERLGGGVRVNRGHDTGIEHMPGESIRGTGGESGRHAMMPPAEGRVWARDGLTLDDQGQVVGIERTGWIVAKSVVLWISSSSTAELATVSPTTTRTDRRGTDARLESTFSAVLGWR